MTTKKKVKLVSDWLGNRHSHSAYDVGFLLQDLAKFGISVKMTKKGDVLLEKEGKGVAWMRAISGKDFYKQAMNPKNPKGPIEVGFEKDEAKYLWLVGGWQIAEALCKLYGVKGSDMYGRGSAFRANLANLREAGY